MAVRQKTMPRDVGGLAERVSKVAIKKMREEEEECEGKGGMVLTLSSAGGPPEMPETGRMDGPTTSTSCAFLGPPAPGPRWPSWILPASCPRWQPKTKTARGGSGARVS
jgi:hypothetical protein